MAVSPQRVMLCLVEKEVEFELLHVNLDTMEHKKPQFLARQPFGKVPCIEDGDFKLYESRAIARYYAAKYSGQGTELLGNTLEERAIIDQWIDVEAMTYDPLVFPVVFNMVILPRLGIASDVSAVNSSVEKLHTLLDVYENQLSKTKYLAGDKFSLADLVHIPATRRLLENCNLGCLLEGRKHVKAWWDDISNRPAWKKIVLLENN